MSGAPGQGEREFFERGGERVQGLSWEEGAGICGPEVRLRSRAVQDHFGALLKAEIPDRLSMAPILKTGEGMTVTIATHSAIDPLSVPVEAFRLLQLFDGRPTSEVLSGTEDAGTSVFSDDLLRSLVDCGVLAPAPPPPVS